MVPLPSAMDDHQTANARYLHDADGAVLMAEKTFTSDALSSMLDKMLSGAISLAGMSVKARAVAKLGAAEKLADEILDTIGSTT